MKKQISSKIVSLVFSVLVICFLVAFYVIAWTEPTAVPPGGNVPAPINVGNTDQWKVGRLGVGTNIPTLQPIYWLTDVGNSLYFQNKNTCADPNDVNCTKMVIGENGNVGIGTTSPSSGTGGQLKLDVEGPVGATKYCDQNGNNCKTIIEMDGGSSQSTSAVGTTNIQTSSTSMVDMQDMSKTITTSGGNLLVNFQAPVHCGASNQNRAITIALLIDGVEKVRTYMWSNDFWYFSSSLVWLETPLSAGTHNIKIQWATSDPSYPAMQDGATYKRVLAVVEM